MLSYHAVLGTVKGDLGPRRIPPLSPYLYCIRDMVRLAGQPRSTGPHLGCVLRAGGVGGTVVALWRVPFYRAIAIIYNNNSPHLQPSSCHVIVI